MSRKLHTTPQNPIEHQLLSILRWGLFQVCIIIILLLFASRAFAWGPSDAAGHYIQDLISLPNMAAGAVLAVLVIGLVNFILTSWLRAVKFGLALVLLAVILSFMGCTGEQEFSFAVGHKPRQNVLTVTGTNGTAYQLQLNDDIPAQNLIAMQTALSNALVLESQAIEQQAAQAKQQTIVNIFVLVCFVVVFVTGCLTGAFLLGIRRAGA